MPSGSDDSNVTFTPEERKRLMKMVEAYEKKTERRRWLKDTGRIWMKWLGMVLAVLVAVKTLVGEEIKGLFHR